MNLKSGYSLHVVYFIRAFSEICKYYLYYLRYINLIENIQHRFFRYTSSFDLNIIYEYKVVHYSLILHLNLSCLWELVANVVFFV